MDKSQLRDAQGSDEGKNGMPIATTVQVVQPSAAPKQIKGLTAATPFSTGTPGGVAPINGLDGVKIAQQQQAVLQTVKSVRALPATNSLAAIDSALLFQGAASVKPNQQQVDESLELLHSLLNKIARLDPDKCFENPVTEAEAPGYFKVIKQPMCLRTMHEKLDRREYRTWRTFVDDFVLICNNAMAYNQKRSRIHQKALIMLRQGKKMLAETELAARRALTLVHPEGPGKAALDEQRETRDMLSRGLSLPLAAASPVEDGNALKRAASAMPHADSFLADTGTPLDSEELGLVCESSDDAAYSSFSDTDMSDEEPNATAVTSSRVPPLVLPSRAVAVVDLPAGERFKPQTEGAGVVARDARWKEGNRDLERRCRWLELRLRNLDATSAGLTQELRSSTAAAPSAQGAAAAAEERPRHVERCARTPLPGLAAVTDIPFVAAHLRLVDHAPRQLQRQQPTADPCLPARVYAGLELVERQIAALRKHLQHTAQAMQVDGQGGRRGGRGGGRGRWGRGYGRGMGGRGRGSAPRSANAAADSFSKRRRLDGGLHDMVAPLKIFAPKFVEKAQVAPIATPGFRLLPDTELKQRSVAVAALTKQQQLPEEVATAVGEEGSSEEDTSDEAYERRHMQREQEERDWYAQYTAGNMQKNLKNKNSKKPRGGSGTASKPPAIAAAMAIPATSADAAGAAVVQPAQVRTAAPAAQPAAAAAGQAVAAAAPVTAAAPAAASGRPVRAVRSSPHKEPQQATAATATPAATQQNGATPPSSGSGRGRGRGRGRRGRGRGSAESGGRGRGRGGRPPKQHS